MAKKKTTKKTVKKPTLKKAAGSTAKKSPVKKTSAAKPVSKKAPVKKASTSKTVTKKAPTSKAAGTKKSTSKAAPAKPAASKPASNKKAPAAVAALSEQALLEQALDKEWTIPQLKRIKTGLNKKDLDYFLQLLLERRAEIIGSVQGMEDARNASLGDIAHMPLHMADVGSDNFEQEFTLGLMESERQMLREIDEAILRMREGYYGVCVDSGRPINRARLEAKPWAKYCIEVARIREKRGW